MNDRSEPFAFVLMPFLPDFDDIYKFGIKQTCSAKGVRAERVDEQHFTETMLERIYRQIENADFIIADMTGKNANVFYEAGYAHAKGKLCILLTQDAADIPFDLKHHQHVIYNGTAAHLADQLAPRIEWANKETNKRKTETLSVSIRSENPRLARTEHDHTGTCDLILNIENQSTRRSIEINAIYVNLTKKWNASNHGKNLPFVLNDNKTSNRILVSQTTRRLEPGGFLQETLQLSRKFWSKYDGTEEKDEYNISGPIKVEVVTAEGTIHNDIQTEVIFEEFPF
jgi:hypothetical protein